VVIGHSGRAPESYPTPQMHQNRAVNLNNTTKILEGFGCKVEILKIETDAIFAKTVNSPPSKARKLTK
jgi:hypothetical protein